MKIDEKIEMDQQTSEKIRKAVENFGGVVKDYRENGMLMFDFLAMQVGCSPTYIFRAEKGSRIVPIHMRVRILKNGLNWKPSEIEHYLVETVKKYEQKN